MKSRTGYFKLLLNSDFIVDVEFSRDVKNMIDGHDADSFDKCPTDDDSELTHAEVLQASYRFKTVT